MLCWSINCQMLTMWLSTTVFMENAHTDQGFRDFTTNWIFFVSQILDFLTKFTLLKMITTFPVIKRNNMNYSRNFTPIWRSSNIQQQPIQGVLERTRLQLIGKRELGNTPKNLLSKNLVKGNQRSIMKCCHWLAECESQCQLQKKL